MNILSDYWHTLQVSLFPFMEIVVEVPLTDKLKQLIAILDVICIENHVERHYQSGRGRKAYDRRSIARTFIAKAVLNVPQTKIIREMLLSENTLRTICGFKNSQSVPSESVFSRSFYSLAKSDLGDRVHQFLVKTYVGDKIVMHLCRDSTEIIAREKPVYTPKQKNFETSKRHRGRPKKSEELSCKKPSWLIKQIDQTPEEALSELSNVCSVGSKLDSKGRMHSWNGYKAHIDWMDGGIPLTVVTTSASVHDSQVAIPMARLSARKVTSLYDLMDSAYDAQAIRSVSQSLGHVAIIDVNKRNKADAVPMEPCRAERYKERSTAERGNSRLKDEFGFRFVRVRGHSKVHLHLMFGILALFADQLIRIFAG